jgi:alanyl-tRNA synthetase
MPTPSTDVRTASQIRREFLEFFQERHDHAFVPSCPVVPHEDPTLLFTNAGMNQFKDVFLGRSRRPRGAEVPRAVNSQKCIRAGGKHNDLEDVGKDTYHHTFFEMLGNWSFGDYFKPEAIEWAWDLLTNVWGLDPDRLYATVFSGSDEEGLAADTEAEEIWRGILPADRVSRWTRKDNFWEMGDVGPCGPSSEIHYDFTPDGTGGPLVNTGHPDVIEIWNLVFIQFNRGEDGGLTPLPARHVDTGMGLERIVRVVQGKRSNYDTDLWTPIFRAIESHTGAHPYQGDLEDPVDVAYRVVADHVRCLTVAISDGAPPGNEGRGYVLRRILRRAVRHAHQTLGVEGPILCDLVPAVVESLVEAFPDLAARPDRIAGIVREEEESFLRTLDRGLVLFDEAVASASGAKSGVLSADDAFRLHDTYGFPIDLTRVMADERGLTVDEPGYDALMEAARERSRRGGASEQAVTLPPEAIASLEHLGVPHTDDEAKYDAKPTTAVVRAIWNGRDFDEVAPGGAEVAVIVNRTNHYAEGGGQIGDRGRMECDVFSLGAAPTRGRQGGPSSGDARFDVSDTQACGGYVLHIGRVVDGKLRVGDRVNVIVDRDRRVPTMANHTGTHLLNHALREVLGDDVEQRGSLVADDRLRFDFTSGAMSPEQLSRTETLVNGAIDAGLVVHAEVVPLEAAQAIHGLRAVFGERYPDEVRVVSIGEPVSDLRADPSNPAWRAYSIELCGGTHLRVTSEIGTCVLVHEQALAAGIRRITALTGARAAAAALAGGTLEEKLREAAELDDARLPAAFEDLNGQFEHLTLGLVARARVAPLLDGLRERVRAIQKAASKTARSGVVEQARAIAGEATGPIVVATVDGADKETLLSAMDVVRAAHADAAVMLFAPDEAAGKVAIAAAVPPDLVGRGLKAGDWVREAAKRCGGGGGGRPDMAQAGGKDPARVPEAAAAARSIAEEKLS